MTWFWTLYAWVYDWAMRRFQPYWEHRVHLAFRVPVPSSEAPQRVLFAGCGTGGEAASLRLTRIGTSSSSNSQTAIVLCDTNRAMLKRARRNAGGIAVSCDMSNISLGNNGFDVIMASNSLYCADRYGALKEFTRLLRPGGVLIVSNPTRWPAPFEVLRWYVKKYGLKALLNALPGMIVLAPFNLVIRLRYKPTPALNLLHDIPAAGFCKPEIIEPGYVCDANLIVVARKPGGKAQHVLFNPGKKE